MKNFKIIIPAILLLVQLNSCAYYNLFFNAEKNYESGQKANRRISFDEELSADEKKFYNAAITKSWKLINIYSDSNKYSDDALFLIGKSHYNLQEYDRAEDIFHKFLQKYTQSDLQTEAQLWMAKTLIQRKKDDEAIEMLNKLITNTGIGKFAAEAYYNLGELYFLRGQDEEAIKYLELSLSNKPGSQLAGQAILQLAEASFRSHQYEKATSFLKVLKNYEINPVLEYRVLMIHISALMNLGRLEEARVQLLKMKTDLRFKDQHSLIASKLAGFPAFEGDYKFGLEQHKDVIKNFNRTAGAALSAFDIGTIYQNELVNFDSSAFYFGQVEKLDNRSEKRNDAQSTKKLLDEYLKIRDQLRKDVADLNSLLHGDSTLVDSIAVESDTTTLFEMVIEPSVEEPENEVSQNLATENSDSTKNPDTAKTLKANVPEQGNRGNKLKEQKKAVTRDPASVEQSLFKNRYALGEYFLLQMQNGDSAFAVFKRFIAIYPQDTALQAKAHYSLYYTCHALLNDSTKADSLADILFQKYPNSVYSNYLKDPLYLKKSDTKERAHELYLLAEKELDQKNYLKAIRQFKYISETDSGSVWAIKSRYSVAYIYDEYLKDLDKAVESYTLLASEYPGSDFARLAGQKISKPVEQDETTTEEQENTGDVDDNLQPEDELETEDLTKEKPGSELEKPGNLEKIDREAE